VTPGDICLRCGGDANGCACGYEGEDGPPLSSSWPDDDAWDCYHRIRGIERDLFDNAAHAKRVAADREQWEQERMLFPWLDGDEV
jgi:hypothetical protein